MAEKQASTITLLRTLMGGLACFAAFVLGLFFTFARFGGSRRGQTGLLFNPTTQSAKLIAVWKEIEPLPLLVSSPSLMFAGYLAFGIGWAFLYRSIRSAWPPGIVARGTRLALLIWSFGAFFELQGPVNLFHEPAFPLSIALVFWTVASTAAAMATVAVIEGASDRPLHEQSSGSRGEDLPYRRHVRPSNSRSARLLPGWWFQPLPLLLPRGSASRDK